MEAPTRYLSQSAVAKVLGVHKQTVYVRRKDGEFPDADIKVGTGEGEGTLGWSLERIKKYKTWKESGRTNTPAWWHCESRIYLSYTDLATQLGWRKSYIWIKAGRGQILRPQVVIGELERKGEPREKTGMVAGETAGFSEHKVLEFGRQEGRLDADGRLIAQPRRRKGAAAKKAS